VGATYARFRCTTDGAVTFTGQALDGEVEDYQVTIQSAVPIAGLSVENAVSRAVVAPSSAAVTYTLTLTNDGNVTLNPVRVVDRLDAGLTFVSGSATSPESSVVGRVVTWDDVTNGAGLAPGERAQIVFRAVPTTTAGTCLNLVLAEGKPPVGDVVTNSDQVSLTVANPSVMLDKRVSGPAVEGVITFTIRITNTGLSVIEMLSLNDTFTGEIAYAGGSPVADDRDDANGTLAWRDLTDTLGDMAPGQVFVIETRFEITSGGDTFSATNMAQVNDGQDVHGNVTNGAQDAVDLVDVPTGRAPSFIIYLPLLSSHSSAVVPLLNVPLPAVPSRAATPGETFYAAPVVLNVSSLPAGGTFYLSGAAYAAQPVWVDDQVALLKEGSDRFVHTFAQGDRVVPAVVEIPRSVMAEILAGGVTIAYRDLHGGFVAAPQAWLIWIP
jgi:uncharacterized repeat protein (TIGR01451 family)